METAIFSLMMQVRRINDPTHRKEKQKVLEEYTSINPTIFVYDIPVRQPRV